MVVSARRPALARPSRRLVARRRPLVSRRAAVVAPRRPALHSLKMRSRRPARRIRRQNPIAHRCEVAVAQPCTKKACHRPSTARQPKRRKKSCLAGCNSGFKLQGSLFRIQCSSCTNGARNSRRRVVPSGPSKISRLEDGGTAWCFVPQSEVPGASQGTMALKRINKELQVPTRRQLLEIMDVRAAK